MRIFVTGAEGQVARSLRDAAAQSPDVELLIGARPGVDLLRLDTIFDAIAAARPDLVVNAAAYTAVDRAEAEPELAFAINRDGARAVAMAAADAGAPMIQFSTDYVFDGRKSSAYVEDDPVNPKSVYGHSKLEGELAVLAANPRTIVLRTAWVFAPFGANFVRTMIRLADERERLRVVDDQIGCPTYAPDLAVATLAIARRIESKGWQANLAGVTHLAGREALTWCGFANRILDGYLERGGRRPPIDAISTSEYPTPARRPANSQLSSARAKALFGIGLAPLDDALRRCLDRLVRPIE